jgi:hypothetical protein
MTKQRSLPLILTKISVFRRIVAKKSDGFIIILIAINPIMLYTKQADHRDSYQYTRFPDKPQIRQELKNG